MHLAAAPHHGKCPPGPCLFETRDPFLGTSGSRVAPAFAELQRAGSEAAATRSTGEELVSGEAGALASGEFPMVLLSQLPWRWLSQLRWLLR